MNKRDERKQNVDLCVDNVDKSVSKNISWIEFLKDVLVCSLGAYGGPEAHYGVFTEQLVEKKRYITEEELVEYIALTSVLPGPSSTQTIVAIGQKLGGNLLGGLTMAVWSIPVLIIMIALSFSGNILHNLVPSKDVLRYIGPMAVGFVVVGAYRISKKVVKDRMTLVLLIISALITYYISHPALFPILLSLGGVVSVYFSKERNLWNRVSLRPPWRYIILFITLLPLGLLADFIAENRIIQLFECFYRYGYLVIGGGQVVIPMMYGELVEANRFLTSSEFLTGFGLVQGLPGPMFSFSAYAGGVASSGHGGLYQIIGGAVSGISIFLPGLLLIFFVSPIWEELKNIKGIKVSLKGITAVAGGFLVAAAFVLIKKNGVDLGNLIIISMTTIILLSKRIPAPIIVLIAICAGFVL